MELTREEGRVLGCLVEKQLTIPQLYPLTENALIAACNQTTNRDPVVAYDVSTVRIATRSLRERRGCFAWSIELGSAATSTNICLTPHSRCPPGR